MELFSLEGLHLCLTPGAYHVSIEVFPPSRSAHCYFQHPPRVLKAIHVLGHMARTAEIFPVGPKGGFSSKKTHNSASETPFSMYSTAHKADTVLYLLLTPQSENPTESQKA